MSIEGVGLVDFTPAHLSGGIALSRAADWPHRWEDWEGLRALSRGIAAVQDGRVVGTIFLTPFGPCATINMVIVDASMRGRGLGKALLQAALDASGGRQCRLIATQDGLPLYEKLGFRATGRVLQHQGLVRPIGSARSFPERTSEDIFWCAEGPVDDLCALDRAACGMDRRPLIEAFLAQGRLALLRHGSAVAGFAVVRAFGRGEVIGPVVARTSEEARALISFATVGREGAFLRIDTPEASGLASWLSERGLEGVADGIVMHRGDDPAGGGDRFRTFALASQALG